MRAKEQEMSIYFESYPENEQFARMVITAFLMDLNPTVEVAVSVAVSVAALAAVASVVAVQEAASDRGKRYLIDIKITSTYNYEIDKDKQSAD